MIKYDDIISRLTLVNILAKDVDYGNVKNIKQGVIENCNSFTTGLDTSIMKTYGRLNSVFYNFVIYKICDIAINFYDFIAIKFKALCKSVFLKLDKSLILLLQKVLLYCQQLILEYGWSVW